MEKKAQIHCSIHKLPLALFIDAIVDNDLFALVISGTPDPAELESAWQDLQEHYSDAMGGADKQFAFDLIVGITRKRVKIHLIDMAVGVLRGFYVAEFEKELIT